MNKQSAALPYMRSLAELRREYDDLTEKLAKPGSFKGEAYARARKRTSELEVVLTLAEQIERTRAHLAEHEEEERSASDPEVRALAAEEIPKLRSTLARLTRTLESRLVPGNTPADLPALLEIRAGTGGEEAALFARDLFAMYTRYAEKRGWAVRLASEQRTDLGGFREVIVEIRGAEAYGILRRESGVHRVQRVPATEKGGRIHTSTATVAVLPVVPPKEIILPPRDLSVETFRASGHGGQNVQKVESAVRVTHLPTGLTVTCQDERSQATNRERALTVLRARLAALAAAKRQATAHASRRQQIGTAERSEKIRTYNFAQDRVTDHRLKKSWYGVARILGGDLDPLLAALPPRASPTASSLADSGEPAT